MATPSLRLNVFSLLPPLTLTCSFGIFFLLAPPPAHALQWALQNGAVVEYNPPQPIAGTFTLSNYNTPTVTQSDISIEDLEFTAIDVINIDFDATGVQGIDWRKGSNSLTLFFNSPLTANGGSIGIETITSDFNGVRINGAVQAVPEPLTILGSLGALGFGYGLERRRRRTHLEDQDNA